jgi:hypothetical protein
MLCCSAGTVRWILLSFLDAEAARCGSGEVEATVEFTGSQTFFGKTATLLQTVDGLGNLQKILLKVRREGGWAGLG